MYTERGAGTPARAERGGALVPTALHPSACRPPARVPTEEQRAQVKGIKSRSLVNKARNEAKRELEEAQSDAPLHLLRVDGRAATLFRNDAHAYAQQRVRRAREVPAGGRGCSDAVARAPGAAARWLRCARCHLQAACLVQWQSLCAPARCAAAQAEGLVPWGAHPGVLIDRYDVRSLLDMYVEPDPR